jgi:hypothetical protein
VLELAKARNRKCGHHCAEAVEDEDSLWKPLEKSEKINHGLSRKLPASSPKKKPSRSWDS